jgi:hypothetical protein
MYFHRFSATVLVFVGSLLPFVPIQVRAQEQPAFNCLRATADRRFWIAESATNSCDHSVQVTPLVYPDFREEHEFELFNNSYRDILFLHLIPLNAPDEEMVFGGTRKLAPGRAWNVNLSHGCTYSLLVEYEDGDQAFYEAVNTCDYGGIQLR